jgi:succinyl-CoA synthetase beta subunit
VKIHEYQAKEILKKHGVPVPRGEAVFSPAEAGAVAERLGGDVVLKAQVHAGGRGKGGGIQVVKGPAEAESVARRLIGTRLVTLQTGRDGLPVNRLLVEEVVEIRREIYLGVTLDRAVMAPTLIACAEGGVDIEEVAARNPALILREPVDPALGLREFQARKLAYALGPEREQLSPLTAAVRGLYRVFWDSDASLAEINPLAVTADGRVLAMDAKINIDDNALFRHPEIREMRDISQEDPLEVEASRAGLSYVKMDGSVGCLVNGAGLAMATMDMIFLAGGRPANFLDVGGGASSEQVSKAFRLVVGDPQTRVVFINIFGGILRCDVLARGVLEAARQVEIRLPVVVRLEGTHAGEGRAILSQSGLRWNVSGGFEEAARLAVQLAGGRSGGAGGA